MLKETTLLIELSKLYLNTSNATHFQQNTKNTVDWESLLPLIKSNKLTALFQTTVIQNKSLFTAKLGKQLFIDQSLNIKKKLDYLKEMQRVQQAFLTKGMTILPYKGLLFAAQFYKDIRQRDTVDMDFAISKNDLVSTKKIMESLGYVEKKGESDYVNLKNSRAYYIDYSWVLFDEEGYIQHWVEFHWQPANSALYCPYIFENLEEKAVSINISDIDIYTFSKVEHALLTVIHHGIVDGWGELRHLVDLVKVLGVLTDEELLELVALTKKYKVYKPFCMGISIAEKVLDFRQERLQVYQLQTTKITSQIKAILSGAILGDWSEKPIKLWYYLRMRDSLADTFKSLLVFIRFLFIELRLKIPFL